MPVFDDAVFLWDPNSDGWSWDRVNGFPSYGVIGSAGAAVGVAVSDGGIDGRIYNGAVAEQFPPPIPDFAGQDWTIFAVVRLAAASRLAEAVAFANDGISNQWVNLRADNAATGLMGLRLASSAAGNDFINVSPASLSGDTAKHVYVATGNDAAGTLTVNGFVDSSTSFANASGTPTLPQLMNRLSIGRIWDSNPNNSTNGEVYAAAVWNRVLSGTEIDEILADPYAYLPALTTPIPRASIFSGSGGGTTSTTITVPANVVTGDDLYVAAVSRDHTSGTALATLTDDDTGGNTWTLIGNDTDRKGYLFHKVATATTAGKTITFAGAVGSCQAVFVSFLNGDPTGATSNVSVEINGSGDESHAGFTPTRTGSIIAIAVLDTGNDTNVVTLPLTANYPLALAIDRGSTGGNDCRASIAYRVDAPGTATGTFGWTQANSTTVSIVWEVMGPDSGVTGTGASTLDDVTSAGSGTYTPPAITGTGASTLDGVTSAGSGTFTPAPITGTGASTLQGVTSAGSGTFIAAITGTGSSTLQGVTSAGMGVYTPGAITGTGSSTLDGVISDGVGFTIDPITGTGASTLDGVTSVGVGVFSVAGEIGDVVCTVESVMGVDCSVDSVLGVSCQVTPPFDVECRVGV
jgi:hypothetical protein